MTPCRRPSLKFGTISTSGALPSALTTTSLSTTTRQTVAAEGCCKFVLACSGAVVSLANGPVKFLHLCLDHAPLGRDFGNPLAHLTGWQRLTVLGALVAPLALSGLIVIVVVRAL